MIYTRYLQSKSQWPTWHNMIKPVLPLYTPPPPVLPHLLLPLHSPTRPLRFSHSGFLALSQIQQAYLSLRALPQVLSLAVAPAWNALPDIHLNPLTSFKSLHKSYHKCDLLYKASPKSSPLPILKCNLTPLSSNPDPPYYLLNTM